MYGLKIAGTDQFLFGPVPVLMVVKLSGALCKLLFNKINKSTITVKAPNSARISLLTSIGYNKKKQIEILYTAK